MLKIFKSKVALSLIVGLPLATLGLSQTAMGGRIAWLQGPDGQFIKDSLSTAPEDTITLNGVKYVAGPAYSPKNTCGECHDYAAITSAYHFMQGVLPGENGMGVSDTWSSENQDGTAYKYLSNAYGHILSGGQFGAW